MPRLLPLILLATACAPPIYVEPAPSEPHATVTVRTLHHAIEGPDFAHRVMIGDHQLGTLRHHAGPGNPITRSVRVPPGIRTMSFRTAFTHTESRLETVYVSEQYSCGTQTQTYGSTTSTTTRYCTRQVPRQQMRRVTVTDGACEGGTSFAARRGARYVVQFDYHANGYCRARCFERQAVDGEYLQLTPCAPVTSGGQR